MHIKSMESGHTLGSKVLVILDDADHVDQVDSLFPVDLPLCRLILITSRDRHVLIVSKVPESSIYLFSGLNTQYS